MSKIIIIVIIFFNLFNSAKGQVIDSCIYREYGTVVLIQKKLLTYTMSDIIFLHSLKNKPYNISINVDSLLNSYSTEFIIMDRSLINWSDVSVNTRVNFIDTLINSNPIYTVDGYKITMLNV